MPSTISSRARAVLLVVGPLVFVALRLAPTPSALADDEWRLVATLAWMVLWWVTEAIPIFATALLPLILFPLLGIADESDIASSYGNPVIALFLGGLLLGAAIESSGLHKRLASMIVTRVGNHPHRQVAGFMAAGAFLSMWVSNTATAVMLFPIALSVIHNAEYEMEEEAYLRYGRALLLGLAWGCSIGGMATLIGSPPNGLLAGFVATRDHLEVSFANWMVVGLALNALLLPLAWFYLTRVAFHLERCPDNPVRGEGVAGTRWTRSEKMAGGATLWAALAWILRGPFEQLSGFEYTDTAVALVAGLSLFVLPGDKGPVLSWSRASQIPWGILLLFGGGLGLAHGFQATGLAETLGGLFSALNHWPSWAISLAVVFTVVMLTEVTSNTATAATLLPIVAAAARGWPGEPITYLLPLTFAASAAFMLPVATPPSAVVFGWDRLRIKDMARAGMIMNVLATLAIVVVCETLGRAVFAR